MDHINFETIVQSSYTAFMVFRYGQLIFSADVYNEILNANKRVTCIELVCGNDGPGLKFCVYNNVSFVPFKTNTMTYTEMEYIEHWFRLKLIDEINTRHNLDGCNECVMAV